MKITINFLISRIIKHISFLPYNQFLWIFLYCFLTECFSVKNKEIPLVSFALCNFDSQFSTITNLQKKARGLHSYIILKGAWISILKGAWKSSINMWFVIFWVMFQYGWNFVLIWMKLEKNRVRLCYKGFETQVKKLTNTSNYQPKIMQCSR